MTYLVENEFSALYIPAKFISKINPYYMEVPLFLSSLMNDEARHIEVFTNVLMQMVEDFNIQVKLLSVHFFHYLKRMIILKALFYFMLWEKELLLIY